MAVKSAAKLPRIYIGELDKVQGGPLFEAIVSLARDRGLNGATVLRGVESFGASHRLHSAKILRWAEDLPMVIEIVDAEERISSFLDELHPMMEKAGRGGLLTVESVQAIRYYSDSRES